MPFGKGKRAAEPSPEALAQEMLPLETVEGSFVRRTDGKKLLLIEIEGVNDSLFTYEQKLAESDANRYALVSVNHPASIIKLPRALDSNLQLVHIDREIAALRREVREMGRAIPDGHPKAIRLKLLEERLRPEAEEEALSGERIVYSTYLVMEFDGAMSDEAALRDARIFVDRVRETEHEAHVCSFSECIEAMQMFFTPRRVDASAVEGNGPVMATRRGGDDGED